MKYMLGAALLFGSVAFAEPHCTTGRVRVDHEGHRLEVALHNRCEARVSCKVEWNLRCGSDERQARVEDVRLDARADETVSLSASSCGDGDWEITPPRWRCDETRPIADSASSRHRR